ncbi:MAG: tRNA (adenosine(37)-N6)-dimethylallyltransferase MiaA [Fusicatenibacter sp.]|nr:tRNA (adenosine(37)-N6)-dimethylallyltransferase MiaA [Fusicatenibacter sp.]
MKRPLLILTGPTAVGKTKLSIALAKAVNGAVISADSMQIYRYMDIGSAKIRKDEMDGIRHYLVDVLDPREEFHVARFQEMAHEAMEEIYQNGQIPIVVGGTGFYIQALLKEVDFSESHGELPFRRELEREAASEGGPERLHRRLSEVDPASAYAIHPHNVKRVIRALEYYEETGRPISEHNEEQKEKEPPYTFAYFVLNDEREHLYRRIDQRVDDMIAEGLVDEVRRLRQMGYESDLVSMQGLGYKELFPYLDGECTLEEAIYVIKRDTRHFAKRQLTWFRREKDVIWLNKPEFNYDEDKILKQMLSVWQEKRNEESE